MLAKALVPVIRKNDRIKDSEGVTRATRPIWRPILGIVLGSNRSFPDVFFSYRFNGLSWSGPNSELPFGDALDFTFVAGLTLGDGDIAPVTDAGRALAILTCYLVFSSPV